MSRREPVQKRSRERIEQILLAAADQLAKSGDANDLTTTSVAKRSGVPVATIYRYFADRMAIITELIDRETAELDAEIGRQLNELETVSLESLLETMVMAHFQYFTANKRSVVLWFGARQSSRVLERVDERYKRLGAYVFDGCRKAGMLVDDVPEFGGEALFWLSDRTFEFMFREDRPLEQQERILRESLEMTANQIKKYATPAGLEGIPRGQFMAAAGEYA